MKKIVRRLRERVARSTNHQKEAAHPAVDHVAEVEAVRRTEAGAEIDTGKLIHRFRYRELDLRLDRDVLGLYRVTVNQDRDRRYSFTVVCPPGDYDALRAAYEEITRFLDSDRRPADLPRHDRLKGHFYGR